MIGQNVFTRTFGVMVLNPTPSEENAGGKGVNAGQA